MLEGVPGAGKSYYAVSERLLAWVHSNRRIYVYVDGFYLDRLSAFEGRSIESLEQHWYICILIVFRRQKADTQIRVSESCSSIA